ncbi:hypothetical protein EDE12_10185 [Methylosinus sp. sav-2]|uniref:hypothetical protein n=1 Tax=Methylosinus sp. sav-2 TaxID=2485168 RepID=UPI001064B975|nr:hypothetical protein [Methylosinus sp. sav-2]TDX66554.1 hypothetical protein EDE12_10185 [Methylosinus sp. sav-2]
MSKPFDDNSTRNAERVSKRDRGISAPKPERRYMLDELLTESSFDASPATEDWMRSPPVGRELL